VKDLQSWTAGAVIFNRRARAVAQKPPESAPEEQSLRSRRSGFPSPFPPPYGLFDLGGV
jgi:hypothetical protein